MLCHIFLPFRHYKCHYCLVALVILWKLQIYIEVSGNKKLCTLGALDNCCNDALQGGGIVRHEVAYQQVPAVTDRHQMKAGDGQAVLLVDSTVKCGDYL